MKYKLLVLITTISLFIAQNIAAINSNPKLTVTEIRGELSFTFPESCSFDDGGDGEWALSVFKCKGTMPIQIMSSKIENEVSIDTYVITQIEELDAEASKFNTKVESHNIQGGLIDSSKSFEFVYKDRPDEVWESASLKLKGNKYFYLINIIAPVDHQPSWNNYIVFAQYAKFK